eukprot:530510-Rhodomonas_salina.5
MPFNSSTVLLQGVQIAIDRVPGIGHTAQAGTGAGSEPQRGGGTRCARGAKSDFDHEKTSTGMCEPILEPFTNRGRKGHYSFFAHL